MFELEPTIYHSEEWIGLLRSVYRYPQHSICSDGFMMPLLRVGPLFGDRLVSVPFSDYGGPAGSFDAHTLAQLSRRLLEETGCDYLEIRTSEPALVKELSLLGFNVAATYFSRVVKTLPDRPLEELWRTSLDKKARQGVLGAQKAGLVVHEATTGSQLEEAYKVYYRAVKAMGSPSHPKSFFERLKEALGWRAKIYVVSKQGRPGGMAVYLVGKTRVHLWARYALEEQKRLGAIYLLDWAGIELAHSLGVGEFDFGRTRRNSGVETYKHHWRGFDVEIYHMCLPRKGRPNPPDPLQARFRFYSKIWRILPDWAIEALGPRVIKSIAL